MQDKIPYTDFTFHVSTWVKSKDGQPTDITIHQTGGTLEGVTQIVDDDPLLVPGSNYVLFLKEYAPGKYFIVGGPTGRLNVNSADKLTAFKDSIIPSADLPADAGSFATRVAGIEADAVPGLQILGIGFNSYSLVSGVAAAAGTCWIRGSSDACSLSWIMVGFGLVTGGAGRAMTKLGVSPVRAFFLSGGAANLVIGTAFPLRSLSSR